MKRILLLPRLKIQNANALSSPYTIGFPAITAWLGAVHALQRKLNQDSFPAVTFHSTAIVNHKFNLQAYKGKGDFVYSIIGTGNPLTKEGKRPAFVEEGRCHLTVSLAVEYSGIEKEQEEAFKEKISTQLITMKWAGGDIIKFGELALLAVGDEEDRKKFIRKLMPGYAIIERRDLMKSAMKDTNDAMVAMLDYLTVKHRAKQVEEKTIWEEPQRKTTGWIVPIATGFHGLTPVAIAKNQRDSETPHRFAESVVTLGEFIMPLRIKDLDEMLWHTHLDTQNNLYLCQQNQPKGE